MIGWIKLHRSMLEWEWFDDLPCFRLFTYLLLNAEYKPTRYMGYNIGAGEQVSGIKALSEKTGLSAMQVRTALSKLKSSNEITIKTTPKFSIITICNWSTYQEDNDALTPEQQQDNKRATTSKERKKGRSITLQEWEAQNGQLTLEMIPKFAEKYGIWAQQHLDKFRNSCMASDRKYIDFRLAIASWNWDEPPKQKTGSAKALL